MPLANLYFAWCWFLVGLITGTVQGLFFHRDQWLGGYASWPRRMARLGHIAFFGTGLLNLCFAFTLAIVPADTLLVQAASTLLIVGAVAMSSVCYLAAWRKPLRHLFFIPVVSLLLGVGFLIIALVGARPMGS